MTNLEAFNYLQNLVNNPNLSEVKGVKAGYAIVKNIKLLTDEVDTLKKMLSNIDGYEDFSLKLDGYKSKKRSDPEFDFDGESEKLKVEYKDAVEQSDKVLNSESEYKPYLFKIENLPADLSVGLTSLLYQLIES
jgi:hypothetical protein